MRIPDLALALFIASHAPSTSQTVVEGEHFRLVCHFEDDAAAEQALEAVEALWPIAAGFYSLEAPEEPLEVHLYRDAAAFDVAEQRLTGGKFQRNQAFAHHDSSTAHVSVQPPVSDAALERLGLPRMTRRLLAHEAAHLLRFTALPNHRSHPRWFLDGAASWLDRATMHALGLHPGVAADPESSWAVLSVQRLLDAGTLPTARAIFDDEHLALGFHHAYQVSWAFFEFLVERHPDELKELLSRIRRRGGGDRFVAGVHEDVRDVFGKEYDELDGEFSRWLRAFEPEWDQESRALQVVRGEKGREFHAMAFPNSRSAAWRAAPAKKKKYTISGAVEILPGRATQLNLLLGRSERGFVSIAFSDGRLSVFDYDAGTDSWFRAMMFDTPAIGVGERAEFRVRVDGTSLWVELPGHGSVHLEDTGHDLQGPWGLGAQGDSAGIWHELEAPGI